MGLLSNIRSAVARPAAMDSGLKAPKTMDFGVGPAKTLTAGLKRIGGRGGISRLGRKGRPFVSHKY
jgi:hypothetical protein